MPAAPAWRRAQPPRASVPVRTCGRFLYPHREILSSATSPAPAQCQSRHRNQRQGRWFRHRRYASGQPTRQRAGGEAEKAERIGMVVVDEEVVIAVDHTVVVEIAIVVA